jgi:hypothetical protein
MHGLLSERCRDNQEQRPHDRNVSKQATVSNGHPAVAAMWHGRNRAP